ncbi:MULTISPECIES: UDP-N-acetylmuramoyl-L-alanyl-D-glutamate--2,6-diaminopimelate ligase [unclassified Vibrio]|uniref:UDP-N-acetylmuramoyl-L-alanyl-D-glutamate--2,6-diaminopimelate ligase n=1 Tax=Vibrio sp. HB236076 TaxID=3232307 RepID=A0AB39HG83_9VIBR|nr:UDP-N-acetylmuramoyl-L-alanyl-D-glutamate--2,6-diaminopimelate ligase [Vibrio sp. HB161653]MDP5254540.1 UDP-N-acetylmuramoyl-L-alanyl-D-glutamate--2,6-diaminopimelate ligase [Vibrio sp. HB161653]
MLTSLSLSQCIRPWIHHLEARCEDIQVRSMTLDSREVSKGALFIAIQGHQLDGRQYIPQAIDAGAVAVLSECDMPTEHGHVQWVEDIPIISWYRLSSDLSAVAAQRYPHELTMIGVTGTNGKTTISQLIAQWLGLLARPCAVMGTTGNGFLPELTPSVNTTGNAVDIQRTLYDFAAQGAHFAVMEVSSHGLVQQRVKALHYQVAVFSNLSRDHLDYHGSMQEYAKAKQLLFTTHQCAQPVFNVDDPVGAQFFQQRPDAIAVSLQGAVTAEKALWAESVVYRDHGLELSIDGHWGRGELTVPLIGEFNAMNVMLALASLLALGIPLARLLSTANQLSSVIGRMELFQAPDRAKIVVDYAHTPDALDKALQALASHCRGQLWCIFGCGGERDTGKRAMMAKIAEQKADNVVVTNDNPRSEDPMTIVNDILAGMSEPQKALVELDRYAAVALALAQAGADDVILLAGKGHEDYQVINGQTVVYSDRDTARLLLEETP